MLFGDGGGQEGVGAKGLVFACVCEVRVCPECESIAGEFGPVSLFSGSLQRLRIRSAKDEAHIPVLGPIFLLCYVVDAFTMASLI